VNCLI